MFYSKVHMYSFHTGTICTPNQQFLPANAPHYIAGTVYKFYLVDMNIFFHLFWVQKLQSEYNVKDVTLPTFWK
jgi:hypothetical protein